MRDLSSPFTTNTKNIIGSGLLAKAFACRFVASASVCIYAAGVSNSNCCDGAEFERERLRLSAALQSCQAAQQFVYFSTCSIADPVAQHSPYVQHKIAMEKLVSEHANFIIARLPQIAGHTPNPHTLLNYLHAKILRSEKFYIWKNATRNIIDVDDVVAITAQLLEEAELKRAIVNIANPSSCPITEIVAVIENVVSKPAITEVLDKGAAYDIDTAQITSIINRLDISFDDKYILRVIQKYYGQRNAE